MCLGIGRQQVMQFVTPRALVIPELDEHVLVRFLRGIQRGVKLLLPIRGFIINRLTLLYRWRDPWYGFSSGGIYKTVLIQLQMLPAFFCAVAPPA